jgi:hypothetical protein
MCFSAKNKEIKILTPNLRDSENNKFSFRILDFIKQRKTDKLALSIFADFAYTAVPFTYDKKSKR